MINGRNRIIATLKHKYPDRIPISLWVHPAAIRKYGEKINNLLEQNPVDIVRQFGPMDTQFYPHMQSTGEFVDFWGSTWKILIDGMLGEVKKPALMDIKCINNYKIPYHSLESEWNENRKDVLNRIKAAREKRQFIVSGKVELFQLMQIIRGAENLFYDIAEESNELFIFRDMILDYFKKYILYWLETDVDGIYFSDDFGSQISLLISPISWKKIFKPAYIELFDMVKKKGKYIFFHSCGHIYELYGELIELGVDAINSQLHCSGIEKVAQNYAGKITFWGEIDRQQILTYGSPYDVKMAVYKLRDLFYVNGGGLIGHGVVGVDTPLENIESLLKSWND